MKNKNSEKLYSDYSNEHLIMDYHCHLPVQEIAADGKFENLTQPWLNGDYYKWCVMRTKEVFCYIPNMVISEGYIQYNWR